MKSRFYFRFDIFTWICFKQKVASIDQFVIYFPPAIPELNRRRAKSISNEKLFVSLSIPHTLQNPWQ